MKIIGFKIWYLDGSMQASSNWRELSVADVLIVMAYYNEFFEEDKRYRKVIDGCDWYWFADGDIHGVRSEDGVTRLPKPDGIDDLDLKRGEWAPSQAVFEQVTTASNNDLVFP